MLNIVPKYIVFVISAQIHLNDGMIVCDLYSDYNAV